MSKPILLSQHYSDLLGLMVEVGNHRAARQLLVHPRTLAIYHALMDLERGTEGEVLALLTESPTDTLPVAVLHSASTRGTETPNGWHLSSTRSTSPSLEWEADELHSPPSSPRENSPELADFSAASSNAPPGQCLIS